MSSQKTSQLLHTAESVAVPEGRDFNVVVVADTHSKPHANAAALIEKLAPDVIVHAGDIGDLAVLDPLRQLSRLIVVRGNIDEHAPTLPDSIEVDFHSGKRSLLKLLLVHIGVYGPKIRAEVARQAHACGAKLVICGHSHVPFMGRDRGLAVFNPGSIGPPRFQLPITLGIVQLSSSGVTLRHVSCQTGQTWRP
jgi:hypothetical protein